LVGRAEIQFILIPCTSPRIILYHVYLQTPFLPKIIE
jgi:hypothetical protein